MKIIDAHAHTGSFLFYDRVQDSDIYGILDRFNMEKAVFSSSRALMDDMVEGNRENYDFVKTDSRCYAYVVINPNQMKNAEGELKKYLGREKVVGVKMHPAQFNHPVNSKESKQLVKIIDSYGLPVLIHTEGIPVARPSDILEIAREYPRNKYIMGHMGNDCWKEAIETAAQADNIYTDIVSTGSVYDQIGEACRRIGVERVLYGSDLTLLNPAMSIGLVMSAEISDEDRDKIFYHNALKVFNFM